MTCYKFECSHWWKIYYKEKSFTRFALQSECCNFNQVMWFITWLILTNSNWKPPRRISFMSKKKTEVKIWFLDGVVCKEMTFGASGLEPDFLWLFWWDQTPLEICRKCNKRMCGIAPFCHCYHKNQTMIWQGGNLGKIPKSFHWTSLLQFKLRTFGLHSNAHQCRAVNQSQYSVVYRDLLCGVLWNVDKMLSTLVFISCNF